MEHVSDVARYLDSVAYRMERVPASRRFGHAPFVTISRQVGADAHALAEAVVAALARRRGEAFEGWQVFDRAIVDMLLQDPRLKVSLRYLLDEEYHSRVGDYLEQTLASWTPQDVVQARVSRAVRALAGAGKVIIVGRAAACAAGAMPGGIHVRLVASTARRVAAIRRRTGLDEKGARRRMKDLEGARSRLVRDQFHRDIDDPLLYDALFNEDRLPTSEIADWIVSEIEKKAHLLERAVGRTQPEGRA